MNLVMSKHENLALSFCLQRNQESGVLCMSI